MMQNIIFDFDGTLIDSSFDVKQSLINAYRNMGFDLSIKIEGLLIGPPLIDMIKAISPDATSKMHKMIIKEFRNSYDRSSYNKTRLYDGMKEILENCRSNKLALFITTNKPILPTSRIVKSLNIDYFKEIVALDTFKEKKLSKKEMVSHILKKWSLENENTLMIGDTENDIIAAKTNSIKSCAVLYGYGEEKMLKASGADYFARKPFELNKIIFKEKF